MIETTRPGGARSAPSAPSTLAATFTLAPVTPAAADASLGSDSAAMSECPLAPSQLTRILGVAGRLKRCHAALYALDGRLLAASSPPPSPSSAVAEATVVIRDATVAVVRTVRNGVRAGETVASDVDGVDVDAAAEIAAAWIADLWTGATEVDNLAGEIVRAYEELHLLYELGESLTSRLSVADASDFVLQKIVATLTASGAALFLNDGSVRVYSRPGEPDALTALGAPAAFAGATDGRGGAVSSQSGHLLTTTLRSGGRSVGSIVVGRHRDVMPFSSVDTKLFDAVGTLAANAIRSAQLHDEARRHAAALRESEAYLRAVMDNVADGIVTLDERGVIRSFNPAAEQVFGYDAQDVVGTHVATLLPNVRPEFVDAALGLPTAGPGDESDHRESGERASRTPTLGRREAIGRRKDGATFSLDVAVGRMRLNAEHVTIVSVRDISERKHAERLLEHQALHDSLTDLPNRALLHDRLDQAVRTAQRDDGVFALMVMDLDRFKDVNDTFGHHFGDLLLRQVGVRLRDAVRSPDTVARLGGDEFAVLLPGADAEVVARAAQRVLRDLERAFLLEGNTIETGASIGIALYPEHGVDGDTLLRRADVAMYVAKRSNSGHTIYSPEHDMHSPERLALVGELRRAIERGELVLHYQPKVDYRSGGVTWAEALVRWNHPQRGQLRPDDFIPLAEQTGLIHPLGAWVLEEALRQCRAWLDQGIRLAVAVNLSMRNLHDWQLPDLIAQLLDQSGVPASMLKIEITESSLMADPGRAMHILSRLRQLGVQVSIDDFGIGYSSLAYLKNLPVSELKIDKSFVQQMATDRTDAAIVRSTISLSHELGLEVVAEGVEDRATWDLLARLGCDLAQGYYLSRPLPPDELLGWMAACADWQVDPVEKQPVVPIIALDAITAVA